MMQAPTPHMLDADGEPDREGRIRLLLLAVQHRGIDAIAAAILALDHLDLLVLSGVLLCLADARHELGAPTDTPAALEASLYASTVRRLAQRCARLAVDRFCTNSGVYATVRAELRR